MRKYSRLSGLFLCILTLCVCSCGGSGSSVDPMGTGTVTLTADATEVQPGGSCTLTATVTNLTSAGTTVPVIGEKVSFTLLTANGGTITAANDQTASGGVATAIYTAGNNMASDTVRVITDVGATASITITKTGGIVGARISTPTASSTSVAAGQTSVVTAMVTDGNSNPMMGETVTFTLPVNSSGASFVNASGVSVASVSASTDAGGNAVAIYQAGSSSPLTAVYDTVRASLANGSSNAVVITRSAKLPPTGLSISVAAAPTSVSAGQVSIVTATLTGDDNAGVTVTFSLPVNNSGASLSASSAVTDGSGKAVVTYTAGPNNPTQTVTDTVRAAAGSISSSAAITRTGLGALSIAVAALPTSVSAGQVGIVTATLTGDYNVGVTVTFSLPVNNSGASLSASSAVTDGSGKAVVTYTAGPDNPTLTVTDTVRAAVGSISSSAAITRTGSGGVGYTISLTANPSTLATRTGTSTITATVKDLNGNNASGMSVHFAPQYSQLVLDTDNATTGTDGAATVTCTSTYDFASQAYVEACVDVDQSGSCSATEPNRKVILTIP